MAALRHDRITAPCVIDGPINGASFRAYIEQFLVPTLSPGDVVVMDNLGSHKGKAVRHLIRAAGAKLLFLPRYSPDLNPIEQVFAKPRPCCAKPARARSRPPGVASAVSSTASPPRNAPTTSQCGLCFSLTGSRSWGFRRKWDQRFESAFLQRPVCLSGEPRV